MFFHSNQMQKLIVSCIEKHFIQQVSKTLVLFLEYFNIYRDI